MLSVAMKAEKKIHLIKDKQETGKRNLVLYLQLLGVVGRATVKLETNLPKLAHVFWTSSCFQHCGIQFSKHVLSRGYLVRCEISEWRNEQDLYL